MKEETTVDGFTTGIIAQTAKPARRGFLGRVLDGFATEEKRLEGQQVELSQKRAEAEQARQRYESLCLERDRAKARLVVADQQFEAVKSARAQQFEALKMAWGNSPEMMPAGPIYTTIAGFDISIASYPEARAIIEEEVTRAEQAAKDFERQHAGA